MGSPRPGPEGRAGVVGAAGGPPGDVFGPVGDAWADSNTGPCNAVHAVCCSAVNTARSFASDSCRNLSRSSRGARNPNAISAARRSSAIFVIDAFCSSVSLRAVCASSSAKAATPARCQAICRKRVNWSGDDLLQFGFLLLSRGLPRLRHLREEGGTLLIRLSGPQFLAHRRVELWCCGLGQRADLFELFRSEFDLGLNLFALRQPDQAATAPPSAASKNAPRENHHQGTRPPENPLRAHHGHPRAGHVPGPARRHARGGEEPLLSAPRPAVALRPTHRQPTRRTKTSRRERRSRVCSGGIQFDACLNPVMVCEAFCNSASNATLQPGWRQAEPWRASDGATSQLFPNGSWFARNPITTQGVRWLRKIFSENQRRGFSGSIRPQEQCPHPTPQGGLRILTDRQSPRNRPIFNYL